MERIRKKTVTVIHDSTGKKMCSDYRYIFLHTGGTTQDYIFQIKYATATDTTVQTQYNTTAKYDEHPHQRNS